MNKLNHFLLFCGFTAKFLFEERTPYSVSGLSSTIWRNKIIVWCKSMLPVHTVECIFKMSCVSAKMIKPWRVVISLKCVFVFFKNINLTELTNILVQSLKMELNFPTLYAYNYKIKDNSNLALIGCHYNILGQSYKQEKFQLWIIFLDNLKN